MDTPQGRWVYVPEGRWDCSMFFLERVWTLLRGDRSLLAIAAVGVLLDALGAALLFGGLAWVFGHDALLFAGHPWLGFVLTVLAFPTTVVATFCNVALLWTAQARLEGRPCGVREGFAAANRRRRAIFAWSLLATGVGAVLNRIAEWLPFGGALTSWVLGVAWSLATMFAVPVLAVEDVGARAAARRSVEVFRARWGEGVIGQAVVAFASGLLALPAVALLIGGAAVGGAAGLAVAVAGGALLGVAAGCSRAVDQLYALAVYRHQVLGLGTFDLRPEQLDQLVKLKRRKGH